MSLKRTDLSALGIESDKAEMIMQAHLETVESIKAERDKYKAEAAKVPEVQKQLDDLKESVKKDYVSRDDYNKTKKEYDDYKSSISEKELQAAREKAVKAYFEGKNIKGDNLDLALMAIESKMKDFEIEDGKLKDTKSLDELVEGKFKRFVGHEGTRGATVPNPPASNGGEAKQPSRAAQIAAEYHNSLYGGGAQNTVKGDK